MNIRQKHILNTLIVDRILDLNEVAEKFAVGIRAIRYDVDTIDEYICMKMNVEAIAIKRGKAVLLLSEQEVKQLHENGLESDLYEIKITPEDRVMLMLCDLCWAHDTLTIQALAERYFVSRATVNSDLLVIKKWCRDKGIKLVSVKGKGIYIDANETQRREYLTKLVRDFKNQKYSQDFILSEWFKDINIALIEDIITDAEKEYELWLSDVSFEGLIIHICLSIKRYQEQIAYDFDTSKITTKMTSLHYGMAKKIVDDINRQYPLQLADNEIAYVAIHLEGKSGYLMSPANCDNSYIEYYAMHLIIHVGNCMQLHLRDDKKLIDGLNQHLRASVYRYLNGLEISNPLKKDLMNSYPDLYQKLKVFICNNDKQQIIKATEDEITYVLLHFAAAMNRQKYTSKKIANVIVVCATGIGTSELVASSLNIHFKMNIKAKTARHHLDYYLNEYPIDLIITTVYIDTTIPIVQVHPILVQEDIDNIRTILYNLGFDDLAETKNMFAKRGYIDEFMLIMDAYKQKEQKEEVLHEIENLYKKIKGEQMCSCEENGDSKMLSEILNEQNIDLNVHCGNWEEAITLCGELLVKEGYVSPQYIQASIDSVKEHGPYIVITKGVALAHASNSYGVYKTGMSFVRLQQGVEFGNQHNDPVTCVFMLATTDSTSHLLALSDLAELLEREEFKRLLNEAVVIKDIMTYIKENESKA